MIKSDLGKTKINKLMLNLGIPMVLAQLVNLLYNLVDRIYIGNLEGIGKVALGGVGVCFPIIIIIAAFAALFGTGGAPLASIQLGKGNSKQAERIMNSSYWALIISSVVLTPLVLLFKQDILYFFGANDQNIAYADQYLSIYMLGTVFIMLALGLNQFINCQGFSKVAMISISIGAVINIALDPILIFGLDMGVRGAAIATVASQAVSFVYIMYFLIKHSPLKLQPIRWVMDSKALLRVCLLGISPFVMQATEALVQISFNTQIKAYYPAETETMYLTAMTIMLSLMSLITMPLQGFVTGCQPIISYNYGAGNVDRLRAVVKKVIIVSLMFSVVVGCMFLIMPTVFVRIFNSDSQLVEATAPIMRVFFGGLVVFGAQIGCQNSFLALGKSGISVILACLRKIILLVPLTFILPLFMGSNGIYFAEMISDLISVATTVTCFLVLFPRIIAKMQRDNDSKQFSLDNSID